MRIPFTHYSLKIVDDRVGDSREDISDDARTTDKSGIETNFWRYFLSWSVGVLVIFSLYALFFAGSDQNDGLLGDSFGMLTSLFTGLAFAGVVATLWVQRQDIKVTQLEMRKSVQAQQDMAAKMEQELSYAKSTHDLELLHKYINVFEQMKQKAANPAAAHLKEISENIIIQLATNLVQRPSFVKAVDPSIMLRIKRRHYSTQSDAGTSPLIFEIFKAKLPATIIDITTSPQQEIIETPKGSSIDKGGMIAFAMKPSAEEFILVIDYMGNLVSHTWRRKFRYHKGILYKNGDTSIVEYTKIKEQKEDYDETDV